MSDYQTIANKDSFPVWHVNLYFGKNTIFTMSPIVDKGMLVIYRVLLYILLT